MYQELLKNFLEKGGNLEEYFNLKSDPAERNNIVDKIPNILPGL